MKFFKIFPKKQNIVIGAIHFAPLFGYADFPGKDVILKNAILDLKAFEAGGADAVIVENNYDIPHLTCVSGENRQLLIELTQEVKKVAKLPVGISVLWNDYETALIVAKKVGLEFIRVPVFVDRVKTTYGIMEPKVKEVINYQKKIGAESVALFVDIHVKHSEILSEYSIIESARLAIGGGADAIIITGKWTGDAPNIEELKSVRSAVGSFPILCGSGVNESNARLLFEYTNGAIASTSLKDGDNKFGEVNLKPYHQRVSIEKVKKLVSNLA